MTGSSRLQSLTVAGITVCTLGTYEQRDLVVTASWKTWSIRLRTMAPTSVRQAYRLLRGSAAVQASVRLPQDLVADCRCFADRVHMLAALPHNGIVAELGTWRGDFARYIVARAEPAHLHLVDLDYSHFSDAGLTGDTIHRHVGYTHEVIAAFPDAHFDWIYIDAGHGFDDVRRDAEASASKVKPGGFLVFNDFAIIDPYMGRYGVHAAVSAFATTRRWPVKLLAFEPHGLYDIALQRPV